MNERLRLTTAVFSSSGWPCVASSREGGYSRASLLRLLLHRRLPHPVFILEHPPNLWLGVGLSLVMRDANCEEGELLTSVPAKTIRKKRLLSVSHGVDHSHLIGFSYLPGRVDDASWQKLHKYAQDPEKTTLKTIAVTIDHYRPNYLP